MLTWPEGGVIKMLTCTDRGGHKALKKEENVWNKNFGGPKMYGITHFEETRILLTQNL